MARKRDDARAYFTQVWKQIFLAGLILAAASCAQPVPTGGPVVLTYASLYPPTHPFSQADKTWIEFVESTSNGKIKIRPYWSGALISSEENMTEIRHGIVDIGMITPMYARSAPLQRVQSSFYGGVGSIGDQIALYKCLAVRFPELDAEIPGLHILAVQGGNFPGILTRDRQVKSLSDLKGLRLRTQHDMTDIVRKFGGDPVDMPMSGVYSAMARGIIDGVIAPVDALASMHLAEVGGHYTALNVPRGAYPARAISNARWQTLPESTRAILTQGQVVWENAMAQTIDKAAAKGVGFGTEKGIKFSRLDAGQQAQFDALYNQEAMKSAKGLSSVGISAEPIIRAGWQMAKQTREKTPLTCGVATKTS